MTPTLEHFSDVGSLALFDLSPGVLLVRVRGHLTATLAEHFPSYARLAAQRALTCAVYLDISGMTGFEPTVVDAWARTVVEFRARLRGIVVWSTSLSFSLGAKAAALTLRPLGVHLGVVRSKAVFELLVDQELGRAAPQWAGDAVPA